jgi:hypothetical protein
MKKDTSSIRFFRPIVVEPIPEFTRFLTEFFVLTNPQGMQAASMLVQIAKKSDAEFATVQDILQALAPAEISEVLAASLDGLSKTKSNYLFPVSELLKFNDGCLTLPQIELITLDILTGKLAPSTKFLERAVLKDPQLYFKLLLQVRMTPAALDLTAKTFSELECAENLSQQFCIRLLQIPEDDATIEKLFLFCHRLFDIRELPKVHLFQLVCSLLIFGLGAHEFEGLSTLFVAKMQGCPRVVNFGVLKPAGQRARFNELWAKSVQAISPDLSTETEPVIRKMMEIDQSLLVDIMNFLMSSCELVRPPVASGLALFAGEVLKQLNEFTIESHLFQLFFSSLLSIAQLFDPLSCVCALNQITRLLESTKAFPDQYVSRILQVLFKRSSLNDREVLEFVSLCGSQFCSSLLATLDDKLHEFLFAIIIELFRQNHFGGAVSVLDILDVLLGPQITGTFKSKYKLLSNLVGCHTDAAIAAKVQPVESDADERTVHVVLNLFLASSRAWMVCAAIGFLKERAPQLLPGFDTQITELLDHDDDAVVVAAESVILLVLVNTQT